MPAVRRCRQGWILAATAVPLAAAAQSRPTALEEVVVTAQKREEDLQDVPLSVTSLTGKDVERLNQQSTVETAAQAPNFNVLSAFGPSGPPQLSVRGVTMLDYGDSNESSVAMYFDEIYEGTPAGQNAQLFDLDRVEIVRGPQGTLYGRNTTGGLVHFVSRLPTDEFEAGGSVQLGSYDQRIVDAYVSGPLGQHLRARLALKRNRDDGYQKNVTTGTAFAITDMLSLRGIVDWSITNKLSLSAKIFYSDSDSTAPGFGFFGTRDPITGAPCTLERIEASRCANSAGFIDPDPDPKEVFSDLRTLPSTLTTYGASVKLTGELGSIAFASITGWQTLERSLSQDCDAAPIATPSCSAVWTGNTDQVTQEFRINGKTASATWILGAFYYADERRVTTVVPTFGGFGTYATTSTASSALFGQVDFALTDAFSLTGGMRYTDERRDLLELVGVTGGTAGTRQGIPFLGPLSDMITAEKLTGSAGVTWRPTDALMGYATLSTGFKSGVFNTTLLSAADQRGPVGEESITAYELGVKTTWWGQRGRLNLALFKYDYDDFQVSAVVTVDGVPVSRFLNAGDIETHGAEVELSLLAGDYWEIQLGLGLLDTQISAPPDRNINGNPLDGNEAPVSPSASLNGLVRYSRAVGRLGTLSAQLDFPWKNDFFFGPDNDPFEHQDAFGIVNLRGSWQSADGHYEVSAFVANLFDEQYAVFGFFSPAADLTGAYKVWGLPRWVGARVAVRF